MSRPPLRPRSHYRHWHRIDTRFGDNDAFGHVNNAVYYGWYDTALNSFLLDARLYEIGQGLQAGSDEIAYIAESSCRYVSALRYPGMVEIGLSLERFGQSSLSWHLGAFAEHAQMPSAEGRIVQVCISRRTERPISIPALWRSTITARAMRPDGVQEKADIPWS